MPARWQRFGQNEPDVAQARFPFTGQLRVILKRTKQPPRNTSFVNGEQGKGNNSSTDKFALAFCVHQFNE
ncbi:MAG: hypothetical protein L0241_13070 [Planctomycetia bacterium]|nr:hypothetical protein [Planctomycetia bacterium]